MKTIEDDKQSTIFQQILKILKKAAYASDVSADISQLESMLQQKDVDAKVEKIGTTLRIKSDIVPILIRKEGNSLIIS